MRNPQAFTTVKQQQPHLSYVYNMKGTHTNQVIIMMVVFQEEQIIKCFARRKQQIL